MLIDSYFIQIFNCYTINAIVRLKKANVKAANCCVKCYLHCLKPQLYRMLFFSSTQVYA